MMTVHDYKILVQSNDAVSPEKRDNPGQGTIDGVSPDFQHLFINGEKIDNDRVLKDIGVIDGTELVFGVSPSVAAHLKAAARHLTVDLNGVGDDKILTVVLKDTV